MGPRRNAIIAGAWTAFVLEEVPAGKACSPQTAVPYEDDGQDANSVIDWIAKQPWSDGQVGMMGGSYDGFTQWATAKQSNVHLKTIVPVVPNNPGNGLPLQNNVFLLRLRDPR